MRERRPNKVSLARRRAVIEFHQRADHGNAGQVKAQNGKCSDLYLSLNIPF